MINTKSNTGDISPAGRKVPQHCGAEGARRVGVDFQKLRQKYPGYIFHHYTDDWNDPEVLCEVITVMHKQGHSKGHVHWYNDDLSTVVLSNLTVSTDYRKQGLGLKIQYIREDIGRQIGARYSLLWVKKRSWMSRWYKRRGYRWYAKFEDDPGMMWMRKRLIK